jgi:signal transduction histidine kinase
LTLLEEARAEADEANRSKSDFMYTIHILLLFFFILSSVSDIELVMMYYRAFLCHELRNPLHAIVAMIDFLTPAQSENPLDAETLECVHTIRASVNMMRSIVVSSSFHIIHVYGHG